MCFRLLIVRCPERGRLPRLSVTVQSLRPLEPSPLGHRGRAIKKHLGALPLDSRLCRRKIRGLEGADSVKEHLFTL